MFDDYKICPYTGLRPFTEDEAIYFKGRDEHIDQATRQLEKNKFIMLTGASGDGKSSLVYAGIIPNAKAGFLKASFSNWAIVDFRPERSPMTNLSEALAAQLNINVDTVRTELGYGFSSLVDIYKSSPLYFDGQSSDSETKRKAANLIILADQFEEFFTNPENFENGIPSQEAMSVTNLLLETARIALEEKLPIYVIITMRSDFIGQCAAFRGLPEYIGFSQFFVPRLNRKELREVIEEPAVLSGNTIERRLTERLIHDIVEGTDQLPILQHALNQIWKMADEGAKTMDLIHYAMVGGMNGSELPTDDIPKFNNWFSSLPPKIQACYDQPDLQNVLNTHANKLYNLSADYLRQGNKGNVSDDDARMVIKAAFKCLTKINNGRAVRNRMTLGEITAIIDVPHLNYKVVGSILDIFREAGNTLLRPFSEEAPELSEHDVLDITHESLIRNWEHLEQWAKEEYNSYTISRDFGYQLNRWTESNKSGDFLLYIGPLTYFESWIKTEKPNAAWVARYLEGDQDKKAKLQKAEAIQSNATEFLKRSARKHVVTRAVVRYGVGRIAAVLGAIAILTLGSFASYNYWKQRNSYVLKEVNSLVLKNASNPKIILTNRAVAICEALLQGDVTLPEVINAISDPVQKINVTIGVASHLVYQGGGHPRKEIHQSLTLADSMLQAYPVSFNTGIELSRILKEVIDQSDILELAYFYEPSVYIDTLRQRNAKRAAYYALNIVRAEPADFDDIDDFNRAIEYAVNYKVLTASQLDELIKKLSPFEDANLSPWVAKRFSRDELCEKGFFDVAFNFNGLYQEVAYLYGAKGNAELALKAIDSLLIYNEHYFESDYSVSPDNAYHIAGVFYAYNNLQALDQFVAGYIQKTNVTESSFYAHLLARCNLYEFGTTVIETDAQLDHDLNLNLEYSSDAQLDFFFDKYRAVLNKTEKNIQELNFQLALSYKDEAIIHIRKLQVSGADSLKGPYIALFDKAMELYRRIDPAYLDRSIDVVMITADDNMQMARKFIFLYPDLRTPFHPNEPQLFHLFFTSSAFIEYIIDRKLFTELYKTEEELKYFEIFLRDYHIVEGDIVYNASKRISYETFAALEKNLASLPAASNINLNLLYLYLGHGAAIRNDKDRSEYYYGRLTAVKIKILLSNSFNPGFTITLLSHAIADLVRFDHFDDAEKLIKTFRLPLNRSNLYAYSAQDLLYQDINDKNTDRLIDSSKVYMNRSKNRAIVQTNKAQVAVALVLRDRKDDVDQAEKTIKNVEIKSYARLFMARALARNQKLYQASQLITDDASDADNNDATRYILQGYNMKFEPRDAAEWKNFKENRNWGADRPISYSDENN